MPSIPGKLISMKTRSGFTSSKLSIADRPSAAVTTLWPKFSRKDCATIRVVESSSTIRIFKLFERGFFASFSCRFTSGRSLVGRDNRKLNVLPRRGIERTVKAPPRSVANWRAIASPRPVPPKRLVIDASFCVNDSKICFWSLLEMPIPVSETESSKF